MRFVPNTTLWRKVPTGVSDPYHEVTYLHDSKMFPDRIIVKTSSGVEAGVQANDYTNIKPASVVPTKPEKYKIDSKWVDGAGRGWFLITITPNGSLVFSSDDDKDMIAFHPDKLPKDFRLEYNYQDTYAALIYDARTNTVFYNCFRNSEEECRRSLNKDWKGYFHLGIVKLSTKEIGVETVEITKSSN